MELLPASHEEFSQPEYWDRFFKKRGQIPFEWYGEYPQLHSIIHKYIVPSNKVLVVGCGNSALSETMYDNGLQNLVNIDISDVVIRQMQDKHKDRRPKMSFDTMDVTQMSFTDCEFNAVLDKGTLDALLVSEETEVVENVRKMFDEICRTLRLGGRYIIISLLQEHVQKLLLHHFTRLGWPIRIHKVDTDNTDDQQPSGSSSSSSSSPLPVFAVILTKLKPMPNMPQIVEVCRLGEQIDRLEDVKYLPEIIKDVQYYHTVRQHLKKRLSPDEQVTLHLHSKDVAGPRYSLTVVDSTTLRKDTFAVFIVPQGREHEWLFSTDKGRSHLLDSANFQRLVVVCLNRGHDYENLEAIKADLSSKVMELAPKNCPPKAQVPFLSIGEDIGKRLPVARGHSDLTGEFLVEDVELNGGQVFRRLVFLSNITVVQSEAKMMEARKKKRRGNKPVESLPGQLKVDRGYLPCDYIVALIGGLAFVPSLEIPIEGVTVGLGAGSFSTFVRGAFPQITMDTVELDPSVVDVAQNWFGLETDEFLRVHVCDGVKFIRDLAVSGTKKDFIVLDADSKDNSIGLNCPAASFVESEFLQLASSVLKDDGVFMLNLACRDEVLKQEILRRIQDNFESCALLQMEEDINCPIYCFKRGLDDPSLDSDRLTHQFCQMDNRIKSVWRDTNVEVQDMMASLKFLS